MFSYEPAQKRGYKSPILSLQTKVNNSAQPAPKYGGGAQQKTTDNAIAAVVRFSSKQN